MAPLGVCRAAPDNGVEGCLEGRPSKVVNRCYN